MAYTTGAEVKPDIATALTAADIDADIIPVAEEAINAYVGHDFYSHTVVEIFDGDRDSMLVLSKYPLISVTSTTVNTTPLAVGIDYFVRDNTLVLYRGFLRHGRGNVAVTYVYGYSTVPKPVARACRLLSQNYIIESQRENYDKAVDDSLAEVSYMGYSRSPTLAVAKDSTGDDAVDRLLEPYRISCMGAV